MSVSTSVSHQTTGDLLLQLSLDARIEQGTLGGWDESVQTEFLMAVLERLAAFGDILLLLGQVRHLYYWSRNSLGLTFLDACVKRLTVFTYVEQYDTPGSRFSVFL